MSKLKLLGYILLFLMIAPLTATAGDFDGSKSLICAAVSTVSCSDGSTCHQGTAEDIDFPQFLRIDFAKNKVSATRNPQIEQVTEIRNMERLEGELILQGVEGGRGWSMSIWEATSKMVITASGLEEGFIVFGACTPQ